MNKKQCINCKWWHRYGAKYPKNIPTWSEHGYCKRYPKYEEHTSNDWCGEWRDIPEEGGGE